MSNTANPDQPLRATSALPMLASADPDARAADTNTVWQKRMAQAFTTWESRYRLTPQEFMADYERANTEPAEYGMQCANYFTQLLREIPFK